MKENKYKVSFTETRTYTVDVLAGNEPEAIEKAKEALIGIENAGTLHYYESEEMESEISVYDVTNTDDPFDPEK